MCPIVSSGVGFSHCWDDFFSLSDSDSDSIEGSLTHFKFSSVPYDILGTGIKYKEIQPPVASFTYSPESPKVGEEITFDASSSYDTDGTIVKYEWDFGDGNRTEGEVVKHAYSKAGNYTVKLTVTDNDGLQDSISKAVFVGNAIFIADARSDKDTYCLNEDVAIRCMVLDEAGNEVWDADVSADIKKPNGSTETISLKPVRDPFSSPFNPRYMYYEGIFTPAPGAGTYENAIGTYSVTIHAKRGEYKDSANLSFDVIAGRLAGRVWYIGFSKGKVTEILKAKGAKVIIKSKDGLVIASLTTDSNGGFKLDSIKPGSYVIDVFWQQGDKSVHYTREVDIPNCGAIWVEFPCNMSELMKRLYKAKALEDYSRLKLRYIAITRDYEIQKTGISLITLPYSAVDAARKASIRLFAEKLFVSHAQDTISDILVGMFQSAAYKQIEQLRKIGNDPPDTDYTEVFKPEMPEPIILPPDYQGIFTDSIVRLANALANQSAIEEALLVSFERYQGALKAGEPEFMRMQLEAIMHYSNLLRENERELKQLIPLVRGEIQSFEDEIGATVQEFQERLSSEGFTPEEEQELRNMGFTDEDLETYKQLLLSFNFTYVLKGLDDLQTSSQSRAESASNLSNQSSEVLSFLTQISGCYIGAYLGGGPEDISSESIQEFNQRMGKPHAIFVRYVDIKDSKNPAHWEWAEEVKRNGAMPMFIYDPWDGLDAIDMTDVEYFASKCKELNV
ncbi:PKD domain-containing protein, partial [Methanophagales archaeon]